jgi:hypothetical protein
MIGRVLRQLLRLLEMFYTLAGKMTTEANFYISSLDLTPYKMLQAILELLGLENYAQ